MLGIALCRSTPQITDAGLGTFRVHEEAGADHTAKSDYFVAGIAHKACPDPRLPRWFSSLGPAPVISSHGYLPQIYPSSCLGDAS